VKTKTYCVYFLQSLKNNSYYIGVTDNVSRRLKQHNKGESKSTISKRPWILKRAERYLNINLAYKRERFLKKMKSRKIIEKIISSGKD
jgi:putative endonuclease